MGPKFFVLFDRKTELAKTSVLQPFFYTTISDSYNSLSNIYHLKLKITDKPLLLTTYTLYFCCHIVS